MEQVGTVTGAMKATQAMRGNAYVYYFGVRTEGRARR
jgi:hypothetical protein